MSIISRSSKILVPIKQCLSFAEDTCFQGARTALKEYSIELKDILKHHQDGGQDFYINRMDTVLFHQDRFEIIIDARGFQPEDIKCKITTNLVEIVAQRQESTNNASRSMSLSRNYQLPKDVKPQEGNCCFSSEGVLLVTAPWLK